MSCDRSSVHIFCGLIYLFLRAAFVVGRDWSNHFCTQDWEAWTNLKGDGDGACKELHIETYTGKKRPRNSGIAISGTAT